MVLFSLKTSQQHHTPWSLPTKWSSGYPTTNTCVLNSNISPHWHCLIRDFQSLMAWTRLWGHLVIRKWNSLAIQLGFLGFWAQMGIWSSSQGQMSMSSDVGSNSGLIEMVRMPMNFDRLSASVCRFLLQLVYLGSCPRVTWPDWNWFGQRGKFNQWTKMVL